MTELIPQISVIFQGTVSHRMVKESPVFCGNAKVLYRRWAMYGVTWINFKHLHTIRLTQCGSDIFSIKYIILKQIYGQNWINLH
jgi:hypothetical protein